MVSNGFKQLPMTSNSFQPFSMSHYFHTVPNSQRRSLHTEWKIVARKLSRFTNLIKLLLEARALMLNINFKTFFSTTHLAKSKRAICARNEFKFNRLILIAAKRRTCWSVASLFTEQKRSGHSPEDRQFVKFLSWFSLIKFDWVFKLLQVELVWFFSVYSAP